MTFLSNQATPISSIEVEFIAPLLNEVWEKLIPFKKAKSGVKSWPAALEQHLSLHLICMTRSFGKWWGQEFFLKHSFLLLFFSTTRGGARSTKGTGVEAPIGWEVSTLTDSFSIWGALSRTIFFNCSKKFVPCWAITPGNQEMTHQS